MALIDQIISTILAKSEGDSLRLAPSYFKADDPFHFIDAFFKNLLQSDCLTIKDAHIETPQKSNSIKITGSTNIFQYDLQVSIDFYVWDDEVIGAVTGTVLSTGLSLPVIPWITVKDVVLTASISEKSGFSTFVFKTDIAPAHEESTIAVPIEIRSQPGSKWRLDIAEAHDVFIAYASEDEATADSVCAALEAQGFRCWMVARDELLGGGDAQSAVAAIDASKVVVLCLSGAANASKLVTQQAARAFNNEIPIVTLRIEDVEPNDALGSFLDLDKMIDADVPLSDDIADDLQNAINTLPNTHGQEKQGITIGYLGSLLSGSDLHSLLPNPLVKALDAIEINGIEALFDTTGQGTVSYFTTGVSVKNGWEITPQIFLKGLQVNLTLIDPTNQDNQLLVANVSGTFLIGTVELPITVGAIIGTADLWSFGIQSGKTVKLPLSSLVALAGLNEEYLPAGLRTIPDIEIDALRADFNPENTNNPLALLLFDARTASPWNIIDYGGFHFEMESLLVKLEITNATDSAGSVTGGESEKQQAITYTAEMKLDEDPGSENKCTYCDLCGEVCDALTVHKEATPPNVAFDSSKCDGCTVCEGICPANSIKIDRQITEANEGSEPKQAIFGEIRGIFNIGQESDSVPVMCAVKKTVDNPHWTIIGGLPPGRTVTIAQVAGSLLPAEIRQTLPKGLSNIAFSTLEIQVVPDRESFQFTAQSAKAWKIVNELAIKNFDLQFARAKKCSNAEFLFTGHLKTVLDIASVTVTLSADLKEGEGLLFKGSTDQKIPFGKLVTDLINKCDANVEIPEALGQLDLKNLDISFNTQSKDFTFTGEADYEFSEGGSLALILTADVKHPSETTSEISLSAQFRVKLSDLTTLIFDVKFEHGKAADIFVATYHPKDTQVLSQQQKDFMFKLYDEAEGCADTTKGFEVYDLNDKAMQRVAESLKEIDFITTGTSPPNNVILQPKGARYVEEKQVNISSLARSVGPGEFADLLDKLDIRVEIKSLLFAFYKEAAEQKDGNDGSRSVEGQGRSVPESQGTITQPEIGESGSTPTSAPAFVFGLDLGTHLSLSNLPLVGKEFSQSQSIGIDDLRLLVASQQLDADQAKAINKLLTEGVAKLPEGSASTEKEKPVTPASGEAAKTVNEGPATKPAVALASGITVSANLNLGTGKSIPLLLSSGGDGSADADGAHTEPTTLLAVRSATGLSTTDGQLSAPATSAPAVKWVKLQKTFGPVHFERVGFRYQDQVVWFILDASFAAGGLTISLDGLGFGSKIDKFEPKFDLRGLGIDFKNGPLEIGGAFLKMTVPATADTPAYDEYIGKAILKFQPLTLSAIGAYAYYDGHPSMFIYAVLDYPLGGPSFFFVTGLAAGFGYNRGLKMPSIDKVPEFPLVQEACGTPRGITDRTGVMEELKLIHDYVPPQTGQYFLAAGIHFTSFEMIDTFAMLAVTFDKHFEIDLLGLSTITIPLPDKVPGKEVPSLAVVQVAFKASFIPDEGFLGLAAQLTSASYLFDKNCHLTGGLAFYCWFDQAHAGDFILTLGGYHPQYQVPAHYPQVPRLGINWKVSNNLSIKGDAYFALTPSAVMAGGHLEALWASGALQAWFKAGADFLISWKPFHYDAKLYVEMGVSYTYHLFGTHHITVDLGADLHIWGPEFSGTAHVHLWIITFDVQFGSASPEPPASIRWTKFKESFLPSDSDILTASVKDGLVSKGNGSTGNGAITDLGVLNPTEFCLVMDSVVPVKRLHTDDTEGDTTDVAKVAETPANFGNVPMGLAKDKVDTRLTIRITKGREPCTSEKFKKFSIYGTTKNIPAGLWGGGTKAQRPDPLKSDKALVNDVLSGLVVTRYIGGETAEGRVEKVLQATRRTGSHTVVWETGIQSSFASSATAPPHAAIRGEEIDPRKAEDTNRKAEIKESLRKTDVIDRRQKMLKALGFEDQHVTLNEHIVDAFVEAPQIEQ